MSIFVVGKDDNTPYLTMEFVEGRNLREFVRIRGKFELSEATRLTSEIASGLQHAALRGICHRDLKLSNVLMSSRGQAKIVDFGLAADDGSSGDDDGSSNPRTIDYAGLERLTGVRKDDPRSDIYFLGCMYYHMLTGMPPLSETKDRAQRMQKTRFTEVMPILQVDPALPRIIANVVARAMELKVGMRYQSPGEMLKDLNLVTQKLADPSTLDSSAAELSAAKPAAAEPQHALMVVESNSGMQDIFRERLKVIGFRILVTRDPDRALARFSDHPKPADCILFSAVELGEDALTAFNRLGDSGDTEKLPAILLLKEDQHDWVQRARLADHRVVLQMPLKLRELRKRSADWWKRPQVSTPHYSTGVPISRINSFMSSHTSRFAAGLRSKYAG